MAGSDSENVVGVVAGPQFVGPGNSVVTFEEFQRDSSCYTPIGKTAEEKGSTATGGIVFWPNDIPPSMPPSLCTEWRTCHPAYGADKSIGEKVWQRQIIWKPEMSAAVKTNTTHPYTSTLCGEYSAVVAHAHATAWAAQVFGDNMGLAPVLPLVDIMGWGGAGKCSSGSCTHACANVIYTFYAP